MDEKVSDRWVDYEIWVWVNLSSTETVKCMNIQLRNDCRRKTSATSAGSRKDSTLSNVGQRLCMRMPGVKQSFTDTFYSTWTKSDWPISHGRQLVVINSNLPQRSTQAYVSCAQSHTRRSPQRSLAALHGALIAWMKFRIRPQSGPLQLLHTDNYTHETPICAAGQVTKHCCTYSTGTNKARTLLSLRAHRWFSGCWRNK